MIDIGEVLPIEGFNWLGDYFELNSKLDSIPETEVLLFKEEVTPVEQRAYHNFFIAATKGAQLLVDTLDTMCKIMTTGNLQFH